jgi:hypothetical protein
LLGAALHSPTKAGQNGSVKKAHNPRCRRKIFSNVLKHPVESKWNPEILLKITFLASLLFATGLLTSRAQILNGSFESPSVQNLSVLGLGLLPGSQTFTSGTGITDWTVTTGDVTVVNAGGTLTSLLGLFTANTGNQYVLLNGVAETVSIIPLEVTLGQTGSDGRLSQTIATTPGTTYHISFDYRGLAVGVLTNNPFLDIGVTNATGSTAPANGTLSATIALGWQADTFSFVATGSTSTLSFSQDTSGVDLGVIGLDSVSITPLPEPSQYGAAAVAFLGLVIAGRVVREKVKVKS